MGEENFGRIASGFSAKERRYTAQADLLTPVVKVTISEARNSLRADFRQHTGHPSHHPY